MNEPKRSHDDGALGRYKWSLLAVGALIFALLLRHFGTREIARNLLAVWPVIPVMLLIEGFAKLANALGLRSALTREGRRIPLLAIYRLTIEADAVNYLLPAASLGGNALLTRGLMRDGSFADSVVPVAIAGSAQTIAQFLLVFAGCLFALEETPIPPNLRPALWAIMALSLVVVGLFTLVLQQGVFVFLSAVLRRLHIKAQYLLDRAREVAALDEGLRNVLLRRPGDVTRAIVFFACGWTVSALEIFVVLSRMGVAFGWRQVLAIHALAVFVDGIVFFMPAKAGSQEAGKILAFTAVGMTGGAGLTFALLRRVREMLWALLGYALLAERRSAESQRSLA